MLNNEASREALKKAKRIVIKVGTSTITYANGKRNFSQIDRLAREISDLQNQGKEMILVTSGAVAVGVDRMGLPGKPKTIPGKQAAAAVGQGVLMHTYEKFFADYGQIVAQVLITKTEAIDRHRYTNTRNTFMELMRQRVIPIVNENDVVALDELKIGDNDNMSALVAGIVDADLVIILSDVDGCIPLIRKRIRTLLLCPKLRKLLQRLRQVPAVSALPAVPAVWRLKFRLPRLRQAAAFIW